MHTEPGVTAENWRVAADRESNESRLTGAARQVPGILENFVLSKSRPHLLVAAGQRLRPIDGAPWISNRRSDFRPGIAVNSLVHYRCASALTCHSICRPHSISQGWTALDADLSVGAYGRHKGPAAIVLGTSTTACAAGGRRPHSRADCRCP